MGTTWEEVLMQASDRVVDLTLVPLPQNRTLMNFPLNLSWGK